MTDYEGSTLKQVEYSKKVYQEYEDKLKQIQYIKNVLYEEYINTACSIKSIYSYYSDTLYKAWQQQNNKLKKDRSDFEFIQNAISKDFFNREKIKISITLEGLEPYGFTIACPYKNHQLHIFIPNSRGINAKNFNYAFQNRFGLFEETSPNLFNEMICSYKVEDIAKFIEEKYIDKEEETK